MSNRPKPRRGLPRFVPLIVVAAVVAGGLWFWFQRGASGAEDAWRTTPVERGDIRVVISATGTLSATSTVTVGSQISGLITEVLVDFNDTVAQGQVLARIDPATYQAQIEQGAAQVSSARASLAQAQASLRNAELDYARKSDLVEQQLIARSDVDLARATLDQARAQAASAQAQITQQTASTQTSRINLERTVIRSPVDGTILTRSIEPGQTVAASLQAPELFTIAEDLSKMRIELAVDEADIGQVREGQSVSFTADAFNDRRFQGTVEQVRLAATTTNNVVTYPVVVSVDNADGTLLPGLTVNAEIEVSNRADVLRIANAALRYRPADADQIAAAAPTGAQGGRAPQGGGLIDDLSAAAEAMDLDANQQAAFDAALASMRERQQAGRGQQGAADLLHRVEAEQHDRGAEQDDRAHQHARDHPGLGLDAPRLEVVDHVNRMAAADRQFDRGHHPHQQPGHATDQADLQHVAGGLQRPARQRRGLDGGIEEQQRQRECQRQAEHADDARPPVIAALHAFEQPQQHRPAHHSRQYRRTQRQYVGLQHFPVRHHASVPFKKVRRYRMPGRE